MLWFLTKDRIYSREEWTDHEEFSFNLDNLQTHKEILDAILTVSTHKSTTYIDLGKFIDMLLVIIREQKLQL